MGLLSLLFFLAIGAVLLSICYWTVKNGISPMPTAPKIRKAMFDALPEHMEGTIVELGSGWGTLAFPLASRYPRCHVIGYETSTIPYLVSLLLQHLYHKHKNIKFKRRDFFKESMSDVSMAVCYLYPRAMENIKDKFEIEGNCRQLIVSDTFSIPGWKPDKVIEVADLYKSKIYFYRVPEKLAK